jgi:glycosidase
VNDQIHDFDSQLSFTRDVIALRKQNEALRFGKYIPYDSHDEGVLCYGRETAGRDAQRLLMMFNFSNDPRTVRLPPHTVGDVLRSTIYARSRKEVASNLELRPHEGCIIELTTLDRG